MRLGYSVFLLERLVEEFPDSKIHVMYDIGCLLIKHLQKRNPDLLSQVIISIPVFHCYGHKLACQVLYNPRRTKGLGLTDGEATERLWSYLGQFSSITKEITPENRIDLLTDGLEYYGRKIKSKLGDSLVSKIKRASVLKETALSDLNAIISSLQGVNEDTILQWIEDEKSLAIVSMSKRSSNDNLDVMEEYSIHLQKFYHIIFVRAKVGYGPGHNLWKLKCLLMQISRFHSFKIESVRVL